MHLIINSPIIKEFSIIIISYKAIDVPSYIKRVQDNAYSIYDLYVYALIQKPCPWGHKIYNFWIDHFYILSLFDPCSGVEKQIFKEIMHFHYNMTYMDTSKHKNPCPVGDETYNFGRPFLGHHYSVCLIYAWEQSRRFLKK